MIHARRRFLGSGCVVVVVVVVANPCFEVESPGRLRGETSWAESGGRSVRRPAYDRGQCQSPVKRETRNSGRKFFWFLAEVEWDAAGLICRQFRRPDSLFV